MDVGGRVESNCERLKIRASMTYLKDNKEATWSWLDSSESRN